MGFERPRQRRGSDNLLLSRGELTSLTGSCSPRAVPGSPLMRRTAEMRERSPLRPAPRPVSGAGFRKRWGAVQARLHSPSDSLLDLDDLSSPRTARRSSKSPPCRFPQFTTARSAPDAPTPREKCRLEHPQHPGEGCLNRAQGPRRIASIGFAASSRSENDSRRSLPAESCESPPGCPTTRCAGSSMRS